MKKILLLFIISLIQFNYLALAASSMGGEITYRYLGSDKYELQFRIYRDCRGTPFSAPDFSIACGSSGGSAKSLTATRVSITDINSLCRTYGVLCNPANTTISSSNFAIEEQRYLDTIDFAGNESSFASCGNVTIGMGLSSFFRPSMASTSVL